MANNYVKFSEVLIDLTEEEAKWIKELSHIANEPTEQMDEPTELMKLRDELWGSEVASVTCRIGTAGDTWDVHFYSLVDDDPYAVGLIVQAFFKKFRIKERAIFTLQWAATCDAPRVGGFGGGVMVVTEKRIYFEGTQDRMDELFTEAENDLAIT